MLHKKGWRGRASAGLLFLLWAVVLGCSGAVEAATPTPPGAFARQAQTPTAGRQPDASVTLPAAPTQTPTSAAPQKITLLFSGQIVPGRCVQAGVDQRGSADYIYADIRDVIQSADLAIGTVNGSISEVSPYMGCVSWTFILNGSPLQADAIGNAGFDAASVATNHINNCSLTNCGYRPFLDTLANLRRVGVTPIGGGENLAEALQPVVFNVKGVRFAIVSLGEIERLAFAGEDHPGIAILNEENLKKSIAAARQAGDVVIVMPHWGPEYSPLPNPNQMKYARQAVEAGADLVVGNHPHVIQGMQTIDGVQVFYGLGNFVFDQYWELRLRSSLLVQVTFEGKEYRGYNLIPVVSARDGKVSLADENQAAEILKSLTEANQKIKP